MGKRIRHDYTEEFKLEVMSYFCSHMEDRVHTCERFGLSKSTLKDWVNRYVYVEKDVSLQTRKEKMEQLEQQKTAVTEESLRERIGELERSLEFERMRSRAFEKLISVHPKKLTSHLVNHGKN